MFLVRNVTSFFDGFVIRCFGSASFLLGANIFRPFRADYLIPRVFTKGKAKIEYAFSEAFSDIHSPI